MLDNPQEFHYNIQAIGVWRSLVSRLVRVQEASGSNPDTPTKEARWFLYETVVLFLYPKCLVALGFLRIRHNRIVSLY